MSYQNAIDLEKNSDLAHVTVWRAFRGQPEPGAAVSIDMMAREVQNSGLQGIIQSIEHLSKINRTSIEC